MMSYGSSFYGGGMGGQNNYLGNRRAPMMGELNDDDLRELMEMKRERAAIAAARRDYMEYFSESGGSMPSVNFRKRPYDALSPDSYMNSRMAGPPARGGPHMPNARGPPGPGMGYGSPNFNSGPMNTGFSMGPPRPTAPRMGMTRGRRLMRRKPLIGSRRAPPKKEVKKEAKPVVVKPQFYCWFCKVDTVDKKHHDEHLKAPQHNKNVKERSALLRNQARKAAQQAFDEVEQGKMSGQTISYCNGCNLLFCGPPNIHRSSQIHKSMVYTMALNCTDCKSNFTSRINFELHSVSYSHLRNVRFNLVKKRVVNEESCPESYDTEQPVGLYYVCDTKCHFCRICYAYFPTSPILHCKSEEHYEKLKKHIEEGATKEEEEEKEKANETQEREEDENEDEEMENGEEDDA